MSLVNDAVRAVYNCNGATTQFPITQAIQDKSQLLVFRHVIADGTLVPLDLGDDYALLPNESAPEYVEISPALSNLYQVIILRVTPNTQKGSISNLETFNEEGFEEILNWMEMQIQELKDLVDRSAKLSDAYTGLFDTTIPKGGTAGQVLALNATEDGLEWVDKD